MTREGETSTRRGDGGVDVGLGIAVRCTASTVVGLQEGNFVIPEKRLQVPAKVACICSNVREPIAWSDGVVASRRGKPKLDRLIELLGRRKVRPQLLPGFGVLVVGSFRVKDGGNRGERGSSTGQSRL